MSSLDGVVENEEPSLRQAFVDAYPRYVATVLTQRGIGMDELVGDAIVEGAAILDGLLTTLEATPVAQQTASPLELFSEALRPVDQALSLLGVPPPKPGAGASRLVPWDEYALSPGSSQVLGPEAQQAHIVWGLEKAKAVAMFIDTTRGPAVGLLCPRGDVAGLVREAESLSYRTVILPSDAAVSVAVVCADEPDAESIVRSRSVDAKVVVYGRAIDDLDQVRFTSLGASAVVPVDRLMGHLGEFLPSIV